MSLLTPISFTSGGEYLATATPDGIVKIWEISTGTLRQEYTPSSHLSATCSCLKWNPRHGHSDLSPRKKKRKHLPSNVTDLSILAIGTNSGMILIYSYAKGELHTQLPDGHISRVNDISWHNDITLYSAGDDGYIVDWDLIAGSVRHKWKADKRGIYSLCSCSDRYLLSASRKITLWDTTNRQAIQRFSGHATEVFHLQPIPHTNETSGAGHTDYILSAALNDRIINVWSCSTEGKGDSRHGSLVSFCLPDDPVMMHVRRVQQQEIALLVLTKASKVILFSHTLNGRLKKPVSPTLTVQCATSGSHGQVPRPISIIAACLVGDVERRILLVHGSFLKARFETISCHSDTDEICLVRDDPSQSALSVQDDVSKVRTALTSANVSHLVPGNLQASKTKKRSKRKRSEELTLSERLSAITVEQPVAGQRGPTRQPLIDHMSVLLKQGLQSNDPKIINSALVCGKGRFLLKTVNRLPVGLVVPLLKYLVTTILQSPARAKHLVTWIRVVLAQHMSYLITIPNLVDILSPLYQMMDCNTNTSMFGRLCRLQGRLSLILTQIDNQKEEKEELSAQAPLVLFQDESSDEDAMMEDLLPAHSDSDDNWLDTDDENEDMTENVSTPHSADNNTNHMDEDKESDDDSSDDDG